EIDNKAVNEGFMRLFQHQPGYQPWKMYETPWMSQKLLEYAQTGVLVSDPGRPDAPPAWAPNYALGPQFEPQKTPEQLQAEYRIQLPPGGGAAAVRAQAEVNAGKVAAAESRFGADPNATVSGTDLQQRTTAARDDAQGSVAARQKEVETAGNQAAKEADKRARSYSDKHQSLDPFGTGTVPRNRATAEIGQLGSATPDGRRPDANVIPADDGSWNKEGKPPVEIDPALTVVIGKDGVPVYVPKDTKLPNDKK
ncbi:MAG: hypothetical protein ACK5PF_10795, partial [bacterium]